jgi:hypothetical protein
MIMDEQQQNQTRWPDTTAVHLTTWCKRLVYSACGSRHVDMVVTGTQRQSPRLTAAARTAIRAPVSVLKTLPLNSERR